MKLRAQLLRAWSGPLPAAAILPAHYPLEVASERTVCEACHVSLRRQRTSARYPRGVVLGRPRVRYVEKQCVRCGRLYRSEEYHRLVPPQGNYAFDLIVVVGLARFREHRQDAEIQQELIARCGWPLPQTTIGELAQTFLDCLAATHFARASQLRKRLEEDGGYALHLDGTCEPGTETVFNLVAGPRGWTLAGAKMAAEEADSITQLLRRCVERFGRPLASMRDLSSQIETAVKEVLGDLPDLICHYHFLENVGTKLCEKPHGQLTAALRRLKIQSALRSLRKDLVRYSKQRARLSAQQLARCLEASESPADLDPLQVRRALTYFVLRWLEDYAADLEGEYFPFDLPSLAFYRRGCRIYDWLAQTTAAADFPHQNLSTLKTIARHLAPLREDAELMAAAERLEKAEALFTELREVLRLTSGPRNVVLRPPGQAETPAKAKALESSLHAWMDALRQRQASEGDAERAADLRTVLGYLEKYKGNLTGHVIPRPGRNEPFVAERTNNLSEHRFAHTKKRLRRKLGTKKLTRSIQAMRAEELLVANLDDPAYLEILCGGNLEDLPAALVEHWEAAQAIRAERRQRTTTHPLPIRKKTIRTEGFLPCLQQAIANLLQLLRGERAA